MSVDPGLRALIYDWNASSVAAATGGGSLLDETLRDGLQSASVRQPSVPEKLAALRMIDRVGIEHVNLGLPCASPRAFSDALALCRGLEHEGLALAPVCAGRTLARDVEAIVEVSDKAGRSVEASIFVAASALRARVEDWDAELVARRVQEALGVARRAGLPITFVAEDATRSSPEALRQLFRMALDHGAARLCVCDTVGVSTPEGASTLVRFTRQLVADGGYRAGLDWHGHNDRGLGVASALAALEAGADRIHATALGVGERVGNTAMELMLLNLNLAGAPRALTHVREYVGYFAEILGIAVPDGQPLVGRNAFRTVAGVHAAAIAKAEPKGEWLADHVYSPLASSAVGERQRVGVGRHSGAANARHWLREHAIEPSELLVRAILERASESERVLSDDELWSVVHRTQGLA